jgi:hypothetical protein
MDGVEGLLYLLSGKWRWRIDASARTEALELTSSTNPANKMRAPLPFSWRQLSPEAFKDCARKPEMRLWLDRGGVLWRVAAVGPGTIYDYPLNRRHLVFDSLQSWAGIVEFPGPAELGDLTNDELRDYRDMISDFGGRRRGYRTSAG